MCTPLEFELRSNALVCFIEALDRRGNVQSEHLSGIGYGSSVDNDAFDIVAGGCQDQQLEGSQSLKRRKLARHFVRLIDIISLKK